MKKTLFLAICLSSFLSCIPDTKTKQEPYSSLTTVTGDDSEMNEAIEEANETIQDFNDALKSNEQDYNYFTLKTRFVTPDGDIEHIWIGNITLKGGQYYGIVDNLPENTAEVKYGDTIQIHNDNISDWMYLDGKVLHGGYTLRVLRDRMTRQERRQFDLENEMIIY